jgi:hypothetical protein
MYFEFHITKGHRGGGLFQITLKSLNSHAIRFMPDVNWIWAAFMCWKVVVMLPRWGDSYVDQDG